MSDPRQPVQRLGSSALLPAGHDPGSSVVRPRNRRLISTDNEDSTSSATKRHSSTSFLSSFSASNTRNPSPRPFSPAGSPYGDRSASQGPRSKGANNALGLLESSLTQSWTSLQGFASSLLSGDDGTLGGNSGTNSLHGGHTGRGRKAPDKWGPAPPLLPNSRAGMKDVATGSLAERHAALRAAKTASVLESHDGVNGGLDVAGRYKRRTSDDLSSTPQPAEEPVQDYLVYVHHVRPSDTYAGVVLKYRCLEEPFKRLNGLWSRDIQARKWLAIPVDACEIRGRPAEPPNERNEAAGIDHLAPTPSATEEAKPGHQEVDFFGLSRTTSSSKPPTSTTEDPDSNPLPWTNVRWVSLDSFPQPVEVARVSRRAMGYFPPRRKKSLHTVSSLSTPRHSLDASAAATEPFSDSPDRESALSSRRQSIRSNHRPNLPGTPGRSTSASSRSRVGSVGAADNRPLWMRRPGGVGSMGKNVRAPGPEKDYFNSWANRHLPGIAIEEHTPSISVMGSETASFGFRKQRQEEGYDSSAAIVESPFEEGRDVLASTSMKGSGLDRAAAQVETWLRGAFARRPSTSGMSLGGVRGGKGPGQGDLDLIELADTASDDGRLGSSGGGGGGGGLLDPLGPASAPTSRLDEGL